MQSSDTIHLLRECDAGVKMGTASIGEVLPYVKSPGLRGALENCRAARLELGDITMNALNSHIASLKQLRERNIYDEKIESDPANALAEYLNMIKNKKSNIQEDNNG